MINGQRVSITNLAATAKVEGAASLAAFATGNPQKPLTWTVDGLVPATFEIAVKK
jgi:hypothetical protein